MISENKKKVILGFFHNMEDIINQKKFNFAIIIRFFRNNQGVLN
jgi:hypothetical protein